jgi:hypothetical protein
MENVLNDAKRLVELVNKLREKMYITLLDSKETQLKIKNGSTHQTKT